MTTIPDSVVEAACRTHIDYANAHGKPVRYLEALPQPPKESSQPTAVTDGKENT